jgi:hypothetical protein
VSSNLHLLYSIPRPCLRAAAAAPPPLRPSAPPSRRRPYHGIGGGMRARISAGINVYTAVVPRFPLQTDVFSPFFLFSKANDEPPQTRANFPAALLARSLEPRWTREPNGNCWWGWEGGREGRGGDGVRGESKRADFLRPLTKCDWKRREFRESRRCSALIILQWLVEPQFFRFLFASFLSNNH